MDDVVIATGKQYSVRQFIEMSAEELGIKIKWQGRGVEETGIIDSTSPVLNTESTSLKANDIIFRIDPRYFRPTEVETLLGDPSKAKEKLGWIPEITLQEMCKEMVDYDLGQAKQYALLKKHGYAVNISNE
jgi:GDPmannose 4,6-dehydratase